LVLPESEYTRGCDSATNKTEEESDN